MNALPNAIQTSINYGAEIAKAENEGTLESRRFLALALFVKAICLTLVYVRPHHVNIPQRQFMGQTKALEAVQIKKVRQVVDKIFD